jgi:hypothetical protein
VAVRWVGVAGDFSSGDGGGRRCELARRHWLSVARLSKSVAGGGQKLLRESRSC